MSLGILSSKVGFDWPDVSPVWDKLNEEITEVQEAVAQQDADAIEDEIGDLLFTVVNLARHLNVDAEVALTRANAKFEKRFRDVELLAKNDSTTLTNLNLTQLDALWVRAKDINS